MKLCPFCQAPNSEEALACYHCGRALSPNPSSTDPTRPVRLRPVRPSWGQQPLPDAAAPYPPSGNSSIPADPDSPDPTQPFPAKQYRQPYVQPAYSDRFPGPPPPPYGQPVFVPSPPAPLPKSDHFSLWTLLIIGLSLVLVAACGLAFYTLSRASANTAVGLRTQLSTQVGRVFGSAGSNLPAPGGVPPDPTPTPGPALTPTAQAAVADKLLTPECKASLEFLGAVSNQAKSDPLIVLRDAWRMDLDRATADLKTHCGSLDAATPIPGKINQVQQSIDQANRQFDLANQLWHQAVDHHDPGKALEAAQRLGEATKSLGQAISLLQELAQ